jgi:hypothetical protein
MMGAGPWDELSADRLSTVRILNLCVKLLTVNIPLHMWFETGGSVQR